MSPADVPLLIIAFNRPSTLRELLHALRQVQPRRVYFACDGPRRARPADAEKVERTRALLRMIDWDCSLHTLLRETNLGCRQGVYSAVSWFFSQESEGIILEDDCVPHPSFFEFCAELLEKYRHDERVMTISGDRTPLRDVRIPGNHSYSFSRFPLIWGWASWARAWKPMDVELKSWPDAVSSGLMRSVFRHEDEYYWFWGQFERIHNGESTDNWDIQWVYSCLFNHGLSIIPEVNLISNIGFGEDSTHTGAAENPRSRAPVEQIVFPLRHPSLVASSPVADDLIARRGIGVGRRPAWRRLAKHLKLDLMRICGRDVSGYDFRLRLKVR